MSASPRICLVSLRQALHAPTPVSTIQDAFFSLLKRWFIERGIRPSYWNISWSAERPHCDDGALAAADWIFVFSSNEFTYQSPGILMPLAIKSSNERIERIAPRLNGKRAILFSSDAADSVEVIREQTLAGARLASLDCISEADFPLTVQTVRFNQLRKAAVAPCERSLDFAYWGTTKRLAPGGCQSGDARFALLRRLLRNPAIKSLLIGNHFGAAKAHAKFDTNLSHIGPELSRARATWCFQWPGEGWRLTARYHEALALGLIPFAHSGYDTSRAVSLDWQRVDTAEALAERLVSLRNEAERRRLYEEALAHYMLIRPSDDEQYERLSKTLREIAGL